MSRINKDIDLTSSVHSLSDPFDPHVSINHGHHKEHGVSKDKLVLTSEDVMDRAVEGAVVRALFAGNEISRRNFMKTVGSSAALSILSSIFPLDSAKAWAKDSTGPLEKKDLKIGFIPITCATPIIMAEPMKFYDKHGLVGTQVIKAAGWAMIRDWAMAGQVDCAHMLAPMPLAMTMGVGSTQKDFIMLAIENLNGQAITLHAKHKGVKEPKDMKGFTFAVPFDYSMHNMLLRYYLAEGGVDPDREVKIRVLPPPEMVANLKAQNLDGYLSPDPFNQRAVYEGIGFIFKLSKDIWAGHPCCAFATSRQFATEMPNSFKGVFKAIVDATMFAHDEKNRKDIAKFISPRNYLNQPEIVVEQVLTGRFPDGMDNNLDVPDRIDFDPFPWQSMAVWILTQMKRWGYIKGEVDYKKIAEKVFLAADCSEVMRGEGFETPSSTYKKHLIMGKEFDWEKPEEYLNSFTIKRT